MEAHQKLLEREGDLTVQVTDDAMVVEVILGHPVKMTKGSYENIKITTPEDLKTATAFMAE